jgi:hypothetical protein
MRNYSFDSVLLPLPQKVMQPSFQTYPLAYN